MIERWEKEARKERQGDREKEREHVIKKEIC